MHPPIVPTRLSPLFTRPVLGVTKALGEEPMFRVGEAVTVSIRFPVGHYRVPQYIRGKRGAIEAIMKPAAVNNETEGFGQNAGIKGYYYRVSIPLCEVWTGYVGSPSDGLRIEIFESWLERS